MTRFMAFLGVLASGDVSENAMHDATNNVRIISLIASRYPADLVTGHYASATSGNECDTDPGFRCAPTTLASV